MFGLKKTSHSGKGKLPYLHVRSNPVTTSARKRIPRSLHSWLTRFMRMIPYSCLRTRTKRQGAFEGKVFAFIAAVSTGLCLRTSANVTQVNELTAWKPLCKGREVMAHCTASNNQRSVWVWWQFALFCPCSRQPILFIRTTGVDFYGAGFVVGRRLRVRFQGIQYMSLSMKCAPSRQRGIHASAKEQTRVVDFHWWFYHIWIILLY